MGRHITKEAGFTLVEVLSVLVVIGLMSSVVILSIPQPKSGLERQAERLSVELNALAQVHLELRHLTQRLVVRLASPIPIWVAVLRVSQQTT